MSESEFRSTKRLAVAVVLLMTQLGYRLSSVEAFSTIPESTSISLATKRHGLPELKVGCSIAAVRCLSSLYEARDSGTGIEESLKLNSEEGDEKFVNNGDISDDGQYRKQKFNTVITTLVGSISALVVAAKAGFLLGPLDATTGVFGVYTDGMILRDVGSTLLSVILAFWVVKLIAYGYDKEYYSSKISRKLSHTFLAPFFMIAYPIFSPADGARFFAAVVTLVNAVRLYLAATSDGESSLARSVSRSGDKAEALGGPFIYVCLLSVFILIFWRSSMIGIVAASTMAAGDGMADLVGRKWGKNNKWWFSESKSVAGTVAFGVSASLTSYGLVHWLQYTGCLQIGLTPMDLALRIIAISVICSVVELLPIGDDNFTVPLSAAALGALWLQ